MPARPKRPASTEKKGKPNKRRPQETSASSSAVATNTNTKTTAPPTLSQLYAACRQEPNLYQRQRALNHWDERGALRQVVWPVCLELYSKQQQQQQQQSQSDSNSATTEWLRACQLTALFVSWENRQGVGVQALDFLSVVGEEGANNNNNNSSCWKACLATLLQPTADDWEWRTVLVHFVDVVVAVLQPSSVASDVDASASTGDSPAALWAAVEPHVSSEQIWQWVPARRRELEWRLRTHQAWTDNKSNSSTAVSDVSTAVSDSENNNNNNSRPFILNAIQQVLHLVEGDKLKLGSSSGRYDSNTHAHANVERTEHGNNTHDDPDDDDDNPDGNDVSRNGNNNNNKIVEWTFLHRALELLIDLLSSVPTRTHLIPYLHAIHFAIKCRRALGTSRYSRADEHMFLTQQLLERVTVLLEFPVPQEVDPDGSKDNDGSGSGCSLTAVQVRDEYYRRATILQKMCHRYYAVELPDVIYAGVGLLCSGGPYLRQAVGGFVHGNLTELLHKMRLVDKNEGGPENYSREFLLLVLEEYLTLPQDPLEELQSFPLYPTERVLWDFSRIPPSHSSLLPASNVLALPKLQTHFLSFADYLWRNFTLMRLESAYDIRSDLVDVIRRIRPLLRQSLEIDDNDNEDTVLKTEFTGWARMALELQGQGLELVKVAKPLLGEKFPAKVIAEITIDLGPCGDGIRREWDELGEHDNLFLVAIDARQMNGNQAPLLKDYHLQHGNHQRFGSDGERRVPDEDDRTFPGRYGVTCVRGCMILQVKDEQGKVVSEPGSPEPSGSKRVFRVALDPTQYAMDAKSASGTDVYQTLNLVVRRHGKENNFKAVLETVRGLMAGTGSINRVIPPWLQPVLLGQGDPNAASYKSSTLQAYSRKTIGVANPDAALDYGDTFLSEEHVRASFPDAKVIVDGREEVANGKDNNDKRRLNYRVRVIESDGKPTVEATPYPFLEHVKGNPVRFTPRQVGAIRSGLSPGLTVVVGPPGTGKTDVAVQIIASLYHSFPTQRTVVITHSNAALNDIFQKVMSRGDVNERYLLRLGGGERDLQTDSTHDFTKPGRVAYSFAKRGELLEQVQLLSESLGISSKVERGADGASSYTCETAEYFNQHHVQKRIRAFDRQAREASVSSDDVEVSCFFPFASYFQTGDAPVTLTEAKSFYLSLNAIFAELAEYRPLELLRSQRQRTDYLLMKQARVVAMTCTHAAIARSHLIELGFEYDNIVVEEAGQMMEIETFVPFLLQQGEADDSSSGNSRLKRICLMGDHNQLPPVVKNMSFAKYSSLDQSLFSRLIRLGVPYIQLDKQGRARPEIASLYSWRYDNLGNLDHVLQSDEYTVANPGLAHTFQMINVEDFEGKGESAPTSHFFQNVGEAEYAVALFQYMVLIGYSANKISILTTYNGQKALITDILSQRCGAGTPLAGVRPRAISTVDQYQGQQNDYIILSLVRTESVGHLRDVRRLVVAVSRARFGLYVLGRQEVFAGCHELKSTMDQLASRPNKLQLIIGETHPTERKVNDKLPKQVFEVDDLSHLGSLVHSMQDEWMTKP
jgi:intron-binding protein aquarius